MTIGGDHALVDRQLEPRPVAGRKDALGALDFGAEDRFQALPVACQQQRQRRNLRQAIELQLLARYRPLPFLALERRAAGDGRLHVLDERLLAEAMANAQREASLAQRQVRSVEIDRVVGVWDGVHTRVPFHAFAGLGGKGEFEFGFHVVRKRAKAREVTQSTLRLAVVASLCRKARIRPAQVKCILTAQIIRGNPGRAVAWLFLRAVL
jgi:hypothetical protein